MKSTTSILVFSVVSCALLSLGAAQKLKEEPEKNAKFFVQSYSTRTWTFVSSFTSTIFYTCYTTADPAPAACEGRKLRRARKIDIPLDKDGDVLSSSLLGSDFSEDDVDKLDKKFFTVWVTSSTTITLTTTSTNRSATISARVLCTYPGVVYNLC